MARTYLRGTVRERFEPRVDRSGGPKACHLWKGRVWDGRAVFDTLDRKSATNAARVAWALVVGEPPDDMFVCHTCDNPLCVNPAHLFLDSHEGNMADMKAKGRASRGEHRHNAMLDEAAVVAIRRSTESTAELARAYGVSWATVARVRDGRSWKHVA